MTKKALNTIKANDMLCSGDKVLIGVSGGADSVALLYFLISVSKIYNLKILAVHINHNLRGQEADNDENFVIELCKTLNIKLIVSNAHVKHIAKTMLFTEEEAGRYIRYKTFDEIAKKECATKIAVAHSLNDNAETIIMRLARGTGTKGLCGIPKVRGNIIRPLIEVTRKEIEAYCTSNNVKYTVDSTNKDYKYTRNIVRHNIVSTIEDKLNPIFLQSINRMTTSINEDNEYLELQENIALKKCLINESQVTIDTNKLKEEHIAIQRRVVRRACMLVKKDFNNISKENTDDVLNLINKGTGKKINISGNLIVEKSYNDLLIYEKIELKGEFCYKVTLDTPIYIKECGKYVSLSREKSKDVPYGVYTNVFNCDTIISEIKIRNRQKGDTVCINGNTKKIKKYFIDKKIPLKKRDSIPLITNGANIICIIYGDNIISTKYTNYDEKNKNLLYIKIWEA
jgi:tRNA(Ile)-lysidine synthase